jgi:preprotein translocase subunit SecG
MLKPDSPKPNLFVNQRETPKFLQNIFLQLATLFLVCLRVFPFSKNSPKKSNHSKVPKPHPVDPFFSPSRRPIIKGRRADLIL